MYEVACETNNACDTDQLSFKAYLSRWMAATIKVAPFTQDIIMPKLQASAQAAAAQCSGGDDGVTCGTKWTQGTWDGTQGVGQQMSALEVIQSNLINSVSGPVTNTTGGTSKGDASAGTSQGASTTPEILTSTITTGDKVGAALMTVIVVLNVVGAVVWMVIG